MMQERERTIGQYSPELTPYHSFTLHHNPLHHKSFPSITTTTITFATATLGH